TSKKLIAPVDPDARKAFVEAIKESVDQRKAEATQAKERRQQAVEELKIINTILPILGQSSLLAKSADYINSVLPKIDIDDKLKRFIPPGELTPAGAKRRRKLLAA